MSIRNVLLWLLECSTETLHRWWVTSWVKFSCTPAHTSITGCVTSLTSCTFVR